MQKDDFYHFDAQKGRWRAQIWTCQRLNVANSAIRKVRKCVFLRKSSPVRRINDILNGKTFVIYGPVRTTLS